MLETRERRRRMKAFVNAVRIEMARLEASLLHDNPNYRRLRAARRSLQENGGERGS